GYSHLTSRLFEQFSHETMNILGWHLFFRRMKSDRPSPFAGVLPRVRTIRELRLAVFDDSSEPRAATQPRSARATDDCLSAGHTRHPARFGASVEQDTLALACRAACASLRCCGLGVTDRRLE